MSSVFIIVDWNKPALTSGFVRNIFDIEGADASVIVVDNGSIPENVEQTIQEISRIKDVVVVRDEELEAESARAQKINQWNDYPDAVVIIALTENCGFACAANRGSQFALDLGFQFAAICNNDVLLEAPVIRALTNELRKHDDVGMIGPRVLGVDGELQGPFRRLNVFDYTVSPFLFPLNTIASRLKLGVCKVMSSLSIGGGPPLRLPYTVMGCFMVVKLKVFRDAGWLDVSKVLYSEERIIAERLRRIGFKVAYFDGASVRHVHKKSISEVSDSRNVGAQSEATEYYLRQYRKYPEWVIRLYRISFRYHNKVVLPFKMYIKEQISALLASDSWSKK